MTDSHLLVDSPERLKNESQLEAWLSRPSTELVDSVRQISSPLVILGAGGKMGPTLAMMARQAADTVGRSIDIIAVSRFHDESARRRLEQAGVRTIACDLLDPAATADLPDAENLIYMVGWKFGTQQNPAFTWATNILAAVAVCRRYRASRIVALSTGNVYPLSEVSRGGSVEEDPLTPLGEYANAAVARERMFEYFSDRDQTPIALLRLFYAVEPRYGVLVDIGRTVFDGQPVPLTTAYFNCIWQRDANDMVLRSLSLARSPRSVWNLCYPCQFSVRSVAQWFADRFGREAQLVGPESSTALLGNSAKLCATLGTPPTSLEQMMSWIADWIQRGGRNLGKPTRFEVRDGVY
jgi:nucleoside-diphosphate-sugar epimerase